MWGFPHIDFKANQCGVFRGILSSRPLTVLVWTVLQERQVGYNRCAFVLKGRWGGDHRLESALTTAAYFFNTGSHSFWGAGCAGNGFCCDMVA